MQTQVSDLGMQSMHKQSTAIEKSPELFQPDRSSSEEEGLPSVNFGRSSAQCLQSYSSAASVNTETSCDPVCHSFLTSFVSL